MADYINPSDYKPTPIPRSEQYVFCKHCGTRGEPSNRYLYRCMNYLDCGRYF